MVVNNRRLGRWLQLALALALLALLALPLTAIGAEPTPAPPTVNAERLRGPVIGLILVAASSAFAIGIAYGLRKRIDALSGRSGEDHNR